MKNKVGKMILLVGMMCILSFAVCACGDTNEIPDEEEQQEDQSDSVPEDEEQDGDSEGTDTEGKNTGSEQPEGKNTSAEWVDSSPDLEGAVKELEDGQLTVIEAILETSDSGGDIKVVPSEGGDDSDFNKISVTYDENTLFAIKTIYDGGARSEMSEATAADLASGQGVEIWGDSSDGELKATQICIIKVV